MIDIEELDDKFSIEGEVGFAELDGDLVYITVANKYAEADICLYGGHVTSFRPAGSMHFLWMSPESNFEVGKPIRGGIPVCFPWFGPHKTDSEKPQHGFARLVYWDVVSTSTNASSETVVTLCLKSSEETKAYWPHDFYAELTIVVGKKLTETLKVTNTSGEPFSYTCALHTYYNVSAFDGISIEGLKGITYYNQLTGENGVQEEEKLEIADALTRHYLNTESAVIIDDSAFRRRIKVDKAGSKVTTVWNPGAETCANIGDLPDDGYETFVCIEATNAFDYPINLNPGESFATSAIIGLDDAPVF
ncbi:MAG TPA: D-hexose-6-phosphate mutarotase [Prolixibacteraceae bacterium]|nr:D-hexose-6-phosphate mutarotase [Prolixibacteraceae bacterium]HPR84811.1 D-hexose-6-phosphate mutarotase [Prolixibacteraceae bacterium]